MRTKLIQPHHKALIFDCDGTLADSMPAHYTAWLATLRRYGLDHLLPHERFLSWGGRPAMRILGQLAREGGVELDAHAVSIEKEQAYIDFAQDIRAIEPVLAIARRFRGRLPMAVATGSRRNAVMKTLSVIGAADWFDAIIASDDVTHHKPHPETFLRAAEAVGVAPGSCLAFEDGEPGLVAARAAGMDVIDVRDMLRNHTATP